MKLTEFTKLTLALLVMPLCGMEGVSAAEVHLQLSTREAYVGMPVILQLSIENATEYEQPSLPEIDGCDVRSGGAPSQSSQITIINGRRSESRSVTMQFLITPRQEGTFEIPPLTFKVDGRSVTTAGQQFVATKSQTGDLLFVEIEGEQEQVYVGQPLEMTLKIWIKPFQDVEKKLTLSEGNMWQMISESSSWGSFSDRFHELAKNNQRPGGQEVLRTDGQGQQRSYYLYEIRATVYPQRPGKIDADDVQIVVNYPTKLGQSRDPFGSLFGRGQFGRGSRLSQMMGDDFFASPFSNRLTVSSTRPIVAEATVDSTEVLPVPSLGRPDDYRGAVGRYEIVTQATPTAVTAGDPITLNIGITGTGPMEFVQAPPLSDLPALTGDFRVADQSLAGFVQDNTKLFSTTIRPRREGITHIPAIPFSFFDPATGTFQTVLSDPIDISVEKSESLSLDSIVSRSQQNKSVSGASISGGKSSGPDFANVHSADVLTAQSPATPGNVSWVVVVVPPIVWLLTLLIRNRRRIGVRLPSFKSPEQRCLAAIDRATQPRDIVAALIHHVEVLTEQPCPSSAAAAGRLRTSGHSALANDFEAFLQTCEHADFNGTDPLPLIESRRAACQLVVRLQTAWAVHSKSQVRRSNRSHQSVTLPVRKRERSVYKVPVLLIAALMITSASGLAADGASSAPPNTSGPEHKDSPSRPPLMSASRSSSVRLSESQQQTILVEAAELYSRATALAETDSAEANDLFTKAAQKYQLLVESGVQNALLYRNLGNAWLQCNQLGRAIASYEQATVFAPEDRQLAQNLRFANSLVEGSSIALKGTLTVDQVISAASVADKLRAFNGLLINLTGLHVMIWILYVSSLLFWGLQIAWAAGRRFPVLRFSCVPLLLLTISLTSVLLASTHAATSNGGVLVANRVTLHAADGDNFAVVHSFDTAQGHRVRILDSRGDWMKVETHDGLVGWVNAANVLEIRPASRVAST